MRNNNQILPFVGLIGLMVCMQCSCGDDTTTLGNVGKDCGMRVKNNKVAIGDTLYFDFSLRNEGKTISKSELEVNGVAVQEQRVNTSNMALGKNKVQGTHTYTDSSECSSFAYFHVISDVKPTMMKCLRIADYEHDEEAFTQGLEFHNGRLYEGTGHYGESLIRHYNPKKQDFSQELSLSPSYFGEGITIMGDMLYQLTYKEGTGFVYDVESMKLLREFKYEGEGWGLSNDGTHLIMTDGTNRLRFIDPVSLKTVKELYIYNDQDEFVQVNELEYVAGALYGNVYGSVLIVRIDPSNGKILEYIDCSGLLKPEETNAGMDVMNGIAYNPESGTFFVTGKYWPKMYEVRFLPK